MSTNYNPKTITNGLVLYLDAANKNSYPGSGTTFTDLVNSVTVSLVNGPTYSSSDGGYLSFDGSNDYIDMDNTVSYIDEDVGTLSIVAKLISHSGNDSINDIRYDANNNWGIQNVDSNGDLQYKYKSGGTVNKIDIDQTFSTSNPFEFFDMSWDGTANELKAYKNGVKQGNTVTIVGTMTTPTTFHYGKATPASNGMQNYLSSWKYYNRVLTDAEVLQNYNAQKHRFGV